MRFHVDRSCSFDRCRLCALVAFALTAVLGSRPVPEHHPGSDQPGHTQVVRVVCMPSEGTARAGQLAPSAVTASAAGGIGDQKCGAESNNRRRARCPVEKPPLKGISIP